MLLFKKKKLDFFTNSVSTKLNIDGSLNWLVKSYNSGDNLEYVWYDLLTFNFELKF